MYDSFHSFSSSMTKLSTGSVAVTDFTARIHSVENKIDILADGLGRVPELTRDAVNSSFRELDSLIRNQPANRVFSIAPGKPAATRGRGRARGRGSYSSSRDSRPAFGCADVSNDRSSRDRDTRGHTDTRSHTDTRGHPDPVSRSHTDARDPTKPSGHDVQSSAEGYPRKRGRYTEGSCPCRFCGGQHDLDVSFGKTV